MFDSKANLCDWRPDRWKKFAVCVGSTLDDRQKRTRLHWNTNQLFGIFGRQAVINKGYKLVSNKKRFMVYGQFVDLLKDVD